MAAAGAGDVLNPQSKPKKITESEKRLMEQAVRVRDKWCQNCHVLVTYYNDKGKLCGGHVHHKKTRGAHGDSAWTLDNMELLCWICHDKENAPQWGKGEG